MLHFTAWNGSIKKEKNINQKIRFDDYEFILYFKWLQAHIEW